MVEQHQKEDVGGQLHLKIDKSNYNSTQAKNHSRLSCPDAREGIELNPSHPEQGPALNELFHNCKRTAILKENIRIFLLKCFFLFLKIVGSKSGNYMVNFFS